MTLKSICDNCIKECCWRAPSGGLDPPVTICPDIILKSPTNADNIRNMTDEELAEWLATTTKAPSDLWLTVYDAWLSWLKQEAE